MAPGRGKILAVNLLHRWFGVPGAVRRWALASVIANVGIIVTGGAVRLTESGLGCPEWPKCTTDSLVATPEMGIYGAIEFGWKGRLFGEQISVELGVESIEPANAERDVEPYGFIGWRHDFRP